MYVHIFMLFRTLYIGYLDIRLSVLLCSLFGRGVLVRRRSVRREPRTGVELLWLASRSEEQCAVRSVHVECLIGIWRLGTCLWYKSEPAGLNRNLALQEWSKLM